MGVKFKIHGLRHTGATQLLNAGCPITSIQAILGHKKLETTLIYARVHDQTVENDFFRAMNHLECKLVTSKSYLPYSLGAEDLISLINAQ